MVSERGGTGVFRGAHGEGRTEASVIIPSDKNREEMINPEAEAGEGESQASLITQLHRHKLEQCWWIQAMEGDALQR